VSAVAGISWNDANYDTRAVTRGCDRKSTGTLASSGLDPTASNDANYDTRGDARRDLKCTKRLAREGPIRRRRTTWKTTHAAETLLSRECHLRRAAREVVVAVEI